MEGRLKEKSVRRGERRLRDGIGDGREVGGEVMRGGRKGYGR